VKHSGVHIGLFEEKIKCEFSALYLLSRIDCYHTIDFSQNFFEDFFTL